MWRSLLIGLGAAAAVTLAGCSELTKQQECNASIEVLNRDPAPAEGVITEPSVHQERLAKKEEHARTIDALPLTDAGLKEHVAAFKKTIDDENQMLREWIDGANNFPELQKRDAAIRADRDKAIAAINTYCGRDK